MAYGDKPFGLRDVKITNSTGTVQVDLPSALKLSFTERVAGDEFRGDDGVQGAVSWTEAVDWELEEGGISLEAYALFTGRSVVTTSSTPTEKKTLTGRAQDAFPWVKIYGKVISESGDLHCKLLKCKIMKDLEGTFEDGKFMSTGIKGIAIDDGSTGIYQFVQNETATTLPTS